MAIDKLYEFDGEKKTLKQIREVVPILAIPTVRSFVLAGCDTTEKLRHRMNNPPPRTHRGPPMRVVRK